MVVEKFSSNFHRIRKVQFRCTHVRVPHEVNTHCGNLLKNNKINRRKKKRKKKEILKKKQEGKNLAKYIHLKIIGIIKFDQRF